MKTQPKALLAHRGNTMQRHPDPHQRALVLGSRLEVLQHVTAFCRQVYHSAFGPDEGERRFRALTLVDAVALWEAGLPESRFTT